MLIRRVMMRIYIRCFIDGEHQSTFSQSVGFSQTWPVCTVDVCRVKERQHNPAVQEDTKLPIPQPSGAGSIVRVWVCVLFKNITLWGAIWKIRPSNNSLPIGSVSWLDLWLFHDYQVCSISLEGSLKLTAWCQLIYLCKRFARRKKIAEIFFFYHLSNARNCSRALADISGNN